MTGLSEDQGRFSWTGRASLAIHFSEADVLVVAG